jgi:tetratricopeptide (TPR) repeat protein
MRFWLSIVGVTFFSLSFAQEIPAKVRTRTIDYAQYDQLTSSLSYATDKIKAANKLLSVSDALFTPEDEEYFNTRKMIAVYFEMAFDHARAAELVQQAIDAYEKHFPFYNRGYATVTEDYALYSYLDFSRYQRALNLFEKSIRYLESKRTALENSPAYYVRQQFYSEYAQCLLGAEQYEEAIKVALLGR